MIELPLVSILIPLYNSENYIIETIESCLNQTYKNIEIIIVDDGSIDKSLEIAQAYQIQNQHIKIFQQKNCGAPTARNLAYSKSSGQYIQYLDADDILHPEKISKQMDVLLKNGKETLVFGPYISFRHFVKNNTKIKSRKIYKDYHTPKKFLLDWWESNDANMPHAWLVSRQLIEKAGNWNEELQANQDGDFFSRVVFNSNKLLYVEASLSYYRLDNLNSISKRRSYQSYQSRLQTYDFYVKLMENEQFYENTTRALATNYSNFYYQVLLDYEDLADIAKEKIKKLGFLKPIMPKRKKLLMNIIGIKNTLYLKIYLKNIMIKLKK